jgi:hypothetical protein
MTDEVLFRRGTILVRRLRLISRSQTQLFLVPTLRVSLGTRLWIIFTLSC